MGEFLQTEWETALAHPDLAVDDPEIDILVRSDIQSIRYALVTQLLGKLDDETHSLLTMKPTQGVPGRWTPRQFCKLVVVPWNAANGFRLGNSRDPYVSNPLRINQLTRGRTDAQRPDLWDRLFDLFEQLDNAPGAEVRDVFRRVLRSLARCRPARGTAEW